MVHAENFAEKIVKERNEAARKVQLYDFSKEGSMRDYAYLIGVEQGLTRAVIILQDANLVEKDKHLDGWNTD